MFHTCERYTFHIQDMLQKHDLDISSTHYSEYLQVKYEYRELDEILLPILYPYEWLVLSQQKL